MRTHLQVVADRAAMDSRRSIGVQLRRLREDAGISRAAVARAAGIHPSYLRLIESGEREASLEVLHRVAAALGSDVGVRIYPNTGPPLRDRHQARMVEALLKVVPDSWDRHVEVAVRRPVRGIIDVVLAQPSLGRVITVEVHSELRRLEQQIGWAAEKSDALPSAVIWLTLAYGPRPVSLARILVLRSTSTTRALARSFAATLAAAYPADPESVLAALLDPSRAWPGNGILWARVDGSTASILRGAPRGVPRPESKTTAGSAVVVGA